MSGDDAFADVVGQEAAVAFLNAALDAPVHAYLFLGRSGSGTRRAARAFAGELLGRRADDGSGAPLERSRRLAASEAHPSLFVYEREGPSISADQAREIVRRASLAPPEGDLQVFLLPDFHLVRDAGPMLLKAIEEPHAGTIFLILADELTPELVTIASRCVTVEFPPLAPSVVDAQLRAEGVAADVAAVVVGSAGGDLERARLLAHDPQVVERRRTWYDAPGRLDGSGHTAMLVADELLGTLADVVEPIHAVQEAELQELVAAEEALAEQRPAERKRMLERHKREERRVRTDELRAGLAAITDRYRDAVDAGGSVDDFTEAAALVQDLCDALVFNPREQLQLQALLLRLPALGGR